MLLDMYLCSITFYVMDSFQILPAFHVRGDTFPTSNEKGRLITEGNILSLQ